MNQKFLDEAKLEASWNLDGLKIVKPTAKMMECQRLHNETGNWDCCDECKKKEAMKDKETSHEITAKTDNESLGT